METKWLEDFVSLAETRSFSRSAHLRHVTQPAFSRRIQALVHWLMNLRQRFGAVKTRLTALNVHDAVLRFTERGCDLPIAYHHPSQPLQLAGERYEMLSLGHETPAPFAKAQGEGPERGPIFRLPRHAGQPVPMLSCACGAYMARVVDMILRRCPDKLYLDPIYEADMSEGLKAMALEGHGLAFLPESAVQKEVKARRLARASAPGMLEATMEVRIYRERPGTARHVKPGVQALWDYLGRQGSR